MVIQSSPQPDVVCVKHLLLRSRVCRCLPKLVWSLDHAHARRAGLHRYFLASNALRSTRWIPIRRIEKYGRSRGGLLGSRAEARMRLTLAIMLIAVSGAAFAQSSPCMPGGSCCINGTCGTLEQFKRNATIVCLQADAIENKSLPQSIELAGRCAAARIMAARVEETQQENAKGHQRALDAQNKLREMGAPLPITAAPEQDPLQWAGQVTVQAMMQGRKNRLRGELATYQASVQCSNKVMVAVYGQVHYRYMDLIQSFAERRLEIASKQDRGELTDQQGQVETNKAFSAIQDIERRRDSGAR
jgi:hypothetical protein